jgi:hypothetical protein
VEGYARAIYRTVALEFDAPHADERLAIEVAMDGSGPDSGDWTVNGFAEEIAAPDGGVGPAGVIEVEAEPFLGPDDEVFGTIEMMEQQQVAKFPIERIWEIAEVQDGGLVEGQLKF